MVGIWYWRIADFDFSWWNLSQWKHFMHNMIGSSYSTVQTKRCSIDEKISTGLNCEMVLNLEISSYRYIIILEKLKYILKIIKQEMSKLTAWGTCSLKISPVHCSFWCRKNFGIYLVFLLDNVRPCLTFDLTVNVYFTSLQLIDYTVIGSLFNLQLLCGLFMQCIL